MLFVSMTQSIMEQTNSCGDGVVSNGDGSWKWPLTILIGGDKTNNVPPNMNSPLPQIMQGGIIQGDAASCRAGDLRNDSFIWRGGTPHLLGTLPNSGFAEWKSSTWNVCGAWKDSFWLPFEEDWVFPHGSNHLSGVEVVSCGQIWPTPFDTNAVASAGLSFEIVREWGDLRSPLSL